VASRRRAQAAAAALTALLLAACAYDPAAYPHGEQQTSTTDGSVLRTVAIYVLLPLAVSGLIAALVWLPGVVRGRRYRPQQGWSAAPVWFAGPSGDAGAAVEHAQTGDVTRGGSGGSW
jgi:hypothetical protein